MNLIYTWHDVERKFSFGYPHQWHEKWIDVNVYSDEVIITVKPDFDESDHKKSSETLKNLLDQHFVVEGNKIRLDFDSRYLSVRYEEQDDQFEKSFLPLFKDYKGKPVQPTPLQGVEVIAFHSYKGGVGRTLSMISMVRSLSLLRKEGNRPCRLLLVDADLEAPGLSWLARKRGVQSDMSLLDALAIIHEEEDWRTTALSFISRKIQETVLRLPVGEQEVEHYFLPVYREDYQLLTQPVTPENVIRLVGREWIITDFLSELGKNLNVDAVVVDLRAGISEFAAPLLFDPRVRKVYVTSTSLQSRCGLQMVLRQIYDTPLNEQYPNPTILVSMVPDEINEEEWSKIEAEYYQLEEEITPANSEEVSLGLKVERLPFASTLIHLEGFDSIDRKLAGTEMAKKMDSLVKEWFGESTKSKGMAMNRGTFLRDLVQLATELEYAEHTQISRLLTTTPLTNIARKYLYSVPISVILGGKGAGKTYAYLHLIRSNTWEKFVNKIDPQKSLNTHTLIVPFLKPKSLAAESTKEIAEYLEKLKGMIGFDISMGKMENWMDAIQSFQPEENAEVEWKHFWRKQLLLSTGLPFQSFEELQDYLVSKNLRIAYVIDGLEELFLQISESENQRIAVRALCQGIINELRACPEGRIGLLVFVRKDVVMTAIDQNFGQFYAQYAPFELKWTQLEALRLALWVSSLIDQSLIPQVPIEKATRDILEENLYPLWGFKLGKPNSKEAISVNWILTALSDFNDLLQARDVIRFLRFAADSSQSINLNDRYLAPIAIRNAIRPCSEQKIEELKEEIPVLKPIFAKLTSNGIEERRTVPFQLEEYQLSIDEAEMLKQLGYLMKKDDGYYMPEIIRHGLGFESSRRGRNRVFLKQR